MKKALAPEPAAPEPAAPKPAAPKFAAPKLAAPAPALVPTANCSCRNKFIISLFLQFFSTILFYNSFLQFFSTNL